MKPLLNSAGKELYVLRVKSTKVVINPRAISNAIGAPVVDVSSDLEYLPIMVDDRPDNDPVFTTVNTVEAPDEQAGEWLITYDILDRPKDEIKNVASNVKRFEADKHISPADFKETVVFMLSAILRKASGLVLTPDEEASRDRLVSIDAKLVANKNHLADLHAAIDAGQKPDIKSGWSTP